MTANAEGRAFLLECIRKALGETEIVYSEICDICALRNIDASRLADNSLTVQEVADQLFLTEHEAASLIRVCKQELNQELSQHDSERVSVNLSAVENHGVALQLSITSASVDAIDSSTYEHTHLPEDDYLMLPPVLEEAEQEELAAVCSQLEAVDVQPEAAPAVPVLAKQDSTSSSAPSVPSYLRPTATSTRQTKKEREAAALREAKPAPVKLPARPDSLRVSMSLLEPTAATLARLSTNKAAQKMDGRQLSKSVGYQQLEKILDSPAGLRVTRPVAFRLAVDVRPKTTLISSDDLALAKAKESCFSPHKVPKHVHEARPLEFRAASSPKKPQDVFVPFRLASLDRHAKQQEALKSKVESLKTADEQARHFSALKWSKDMEGVEKAVLPKKPEAAAATVPKAFSFKSEERIAHYHAIVEPSKKAKEAEQNREKLEEERKAREVEEMSVDEFRKTLSFKARVLPDFSSPFQPTSSPLSPTAVQAFSLKTTSRLGDARPLSARDDYQGHMGFGDEAFAGSLRSSSSSLRRSAQANPLSRSTNLPLNPSQLRKSTSLSTMSRQSLSASLAQGLTAAAASAKLAKAKSSPVRSIARAQPDGAARMSPRQKQVSPRMMV